MPSEDTSELIRDAVKDFWDKNKDKLESINNWATISFGKNKEVTLRNFLEGKTRSPGIRQFIGWARGASSILNREVTVEELTGGQISSFSVTDTERKLLLLLRKRHQSASRLLALLSDFGEEEDDIP